MNPGFDVGLDLQTAGRSLIVVGPTTGFDVGLDLQYANHRLVVVHVWKTASLDVRFDLQAASHCLVMVRPPPASLDVRSDFHTGILLMAVVVKH